MINGGVTHKQPWEEDIDPFLQGYNPSDLQTASEFLSNWMPFLSKGLCHHCSQLISDRVRSLHPMEYDVEEPHQAGEVQVSTPNGRDLNGCVGTHDNHDSNWLKGWKDGTDMNDTEDTNSLGSWKDGANGASEQIEEPLGSERVQSPEHVKSPRPRKSWADMAQEEMEADEEEEARRQFGSSSVQVEETGEEVKATPKLELPREQRERIRFTNVTTGQTTSPLSPLSGEKSSSRLHLRRSNTVEFNNPNRHCSDTSLLPRLPPPSYHPPVEVKHPFPLFLSHLLPVAPPPPSPSRRGLPLLVGGISPSSLLGLPLLIRRVNFFTLCSRIFTGGTSMDRSNR